MENVLRVWMYFKTSKVKTFITFILHVHSLKRKRNQVSTFDFCNYTFMYRYYLESCYHTKKKPKTTTINSFHHNIIY